MSPHLAATRALALGLLVLASALSTPGAARADDSAPTHLFARVLVGAGRLRNETRPENERPQAGVALASELDLGVRLLPRLRLHGTLTFDYAPDTDASRSSWLDAPLRSTGIGAGAIVDLLGFELGASVGTQWTGYMNNYDPSAGPTGSDAGFFVSGTLGYVVRSFEPLTLGAHLLARYRRASDDYHGTEYAPHGYMLGGVLSIAFDGAPLLR